MRPCLTNKCLFANLPGNRTSHFGEGITDEEMKEICWLKLELVAQISLLSGRTTVFSVTPHSKVCATTKNRAVSFVK
jgi:hypothetical protein